MLTADMNYTHSHSGVDTKDQFLDTLRSVFRNVASYPTGRAGEVQVVVVFASDVHLSPDLDAMAARLDPNDALRAL